MLVKPEIRALWDAHDWFGLVAYYAGYFGLKGPERVDPLPWLIVAATVLLLLLWLRGRRRRVYIPLTIGPVTIDLQPNLHDTVHTVIGGVSGTGKSTAVMPIFDVPIGVLCIALDNTRPIAKKVRSLEDGVEWSNEPGSPGWGVGLEILKGPPQLVSESLVAGWTARSGGDTGKYRRIARSRLWTLIETLDAQGEPRSLAALAAGMVKDFGSAEANRACRDWAERLATLVKFVGPSFGSDLDLVEAMRMRKKVLLRMNSFLMPEESPMLGGMLLVQARRVAQEANIPFVLIIEEAGQLKQYQDQIVPLAQAGRDRGVPIVLLTQNMSLLPIEVVNNTSVWVSFAQEAHAEVSFAAERLFGEDWRELTGSLRREAFKDKGRGWAYVRAPEVSTRLVHIRQQEPKKPASPKKVPPVVPTRQEAYGLLPWAKALPALPEPFVPARVAPWWIGRNADRLRVWSYLEYDDKPAVMWHPEKGFWEGSPCLLWRGTPNEPRPKVKIDGSTVTVYIEAYKWAGGSIPDSFTLDHICGQPRCCEPEHLEPCTIAENNRRRSARKKALALIAA